MVDVKISLIAGDDVIEITNGSDYVLTNEVLGFGVPPTQVRIEPSAADGGIFRYSKRGVRELDMPIVVFGETRLEVEQRLRRLSNLMRHTPFTIKATYASGEEWDLKGIYVGGAETQYGNDAGQHFCRWVIQVQCPNPFWVRTTSESYAVGATGIGRGLIPWLAELRVSSSQAAGEISIENPGDVDAYPVWTFRGPFDSVTVANGDNTQSFVLNATLVQGEFIIIDTFAATVIDHNGTNRYGDLGPSPKLFTIPAENSEVFVEATNADVNTLVSMNFQPRKEVVH